jgi:P-type Ca2+ transporter type 2C
VGSWYNLSPNESLDRLETDPSSGLSAETAAKRIEEQGPNELVDRGVKNPWLIVWEQLTGIMVVILIIAAVVSVFLHEYTDAAVIMIIVVINAAIGFSQEYRAEKAMAALKRLSVPNVRVRRGGYIHEIPAREIVAGDILVLDAGNIVPADCRLIEGFNLRIQEAALTGESEPVEKTTAAIAGEDVPLGDRTNMAYMGTIVIYGRGLGVVTDTGMRTELGRIAEMIQTVSHEQTPLQKRLDQLGNKLAIVAVLLIAVIVALGLMRGTGFVTIFLTAISMAVAAVPEGLPAVVTIALAIGAQRMLRQKALIRKLPAVETLGSVTVICSDKTGTLTENNMTAILLESTVSRIEIPRLQLAPDGSCGEKELPCEDSSLNLLLAGSALCTDATLLAERKAASCFQTMGDPTEGALVVAAARYGLDKYLLENLLPRVEEIPFDSERKRMTTVHRVPEQENIPPELGCGWIDRARNGSPFIAFTKGAVDGLLDVSNRVWTADGIEPLTDDWRRRIVHSNEEMTGRGIRVLGLAFRPVDSLGRSGEIERDLVFVGMVGMIDPARPEAKDSVATCKTAGIRPVMITGDHPLTAQYIARELGIYSGGDIITGRDIDRMSVEELERVVGDITVYARVSPEHKLKIVTALQNTGEIVAMTGDGVNDAPALKKSDIGVAMGITGTDVSKEAADMVLLDDNFATIVAAVKEGRVIFDNVRKFIKYLISSNSAEIWVMLIAPFLGMPLPLLPLQILWINLLTDGLPAVALAVEPPERNIMKRPPFRPRESVFSRGVGAFLIWVGLLMGAISLGMGYWYWSHGRADWQTMVFTVLTLSQMANVMAIRSGNDSLFTVGLFSNTPLLLSVISTFVLQLAVVYIPFLQVAFGTVALPPSDIVVSLLLSGIIFVAVEIEKWFRRRGGTV